MNCAQFLEIFSEKYFPQSIHDRKVSEFENLKQGSKIVVEYEAQFTKLARFAPYIVDIDYKKARKFERGLPDSILEKINVLQVQKYVDVLDKAIITEGNQASRNRYSDWKGKMQGSNMHKRLTSSQNKKQNLGTSNTTGFNQDSPSTCLECGKKHRGVCHRASRACFKCRKTRHMMRDCLIFGQQKGNRPTASSAGSTPATKTPTRPTTSQENVRQGRVFALVPGDVQNLDTVVSSTLSINGQLAHVLLDSSSTHSFV
ncbi:uncharacterized protein LOC114310276 [Camellia sinensis]|uniref:uncharacterized protein LOC114310276 n=1 Tax=Camellia sinensis TaxID=4442 RepID=UPI0010360AFF|nr:uncharacterized protein LOC114310276 [Camellia sinensis]